ncbi:MAG: hypothetical protein ACREN6_09665, partial [Gemmatimonadaceae bacterium]
VLIAFAPLLRLMPAPLGAPLVGGSANLSIAIFFLTSVLSTWEQERAEHSGTKIQDELAA